MGKGAGPPPDYEGAARAQAKETANANRADVSTPFASQRWSQGPDGRWQMNAGFGGVLGGTANQLQGQADDALSGALDFSGLGEVTDGSAARNQAIDAAYGQATSRLNPRFAQEEQALEAKLANQGLAPTSEAYRNAKREFSMGKNDAYSSAMNGAIGQGTAAGDSVFRNDLMGRQQSLSELIRKRSQPLADLQQMQGLLATPGYNQLQGPQLLQAMGLLGNYNLQNKQMSNEGWADAIMGVGQIGATVGPMLSDARAKQNIRPIGHDAIPGVPLVTFEYKHLPGVRIVGVLAQDLEKVAPKYVSTRPDGLKQVDYSFLDEVSHG